MVERRTTRGFLATFVLVQFAGWILSFNFCAESSAAMNGADGPVLNGDRIASGFDTRLNNEAARAYGTMNLTGASVMSQVTPDMVAKMFPGAPRANIEKYLPLVRKALAERDLTDKAMVLMALATVRVETFTFAPISEAQSPLNTQPPGPPFNKYDRRADLGNHGPPDGAKFKGRGFIQLTGRKNYDYYGDLLGYNLIGNPELANSPQPAARILAAYLKENEDTIRSALVAGDLAGARKTVNGGGNGLSAFTSAFLLGNKLISGYDSELALLNGPSTRREVKKVNAVSISTPASKAEKSRARKRDDDRDENVIAKKKDKDDDKNETAIAKKRDDDKDGKTSAKKKDKDDDKGGNDSEENKEPEVKTKKKGFFLFRVIRAISQ